MNQDIVNISKLADASLELAKTQDPSGEITDSAPYEKWKQVCEDTIAQMGVSDEIRYLRDCFGLDKQTLALICLLLLPEIDNRYSNFFSEFTGNKSNIPNLDTAATLVSADYDSKNALISRFTPGEPLTFWQLLITGDEKTPAQKSIHAGPQLISYVAGKLNEPAGDLITSCTDSPLNLAADNNILALRNQFQIIRGGFDERELTVAIRLAKNYHNQPLYRLNTNILKAQSNPEDSLRQTLIYVLFRNGLIYWQNCLEDLDANSSWTSYVNAWLKPKNTILFAGESDATNLPPTLNPYLVGTINLTPLTRQMEKDVWQSMGNALLGKNNINWTTVNNSYNMNMQRIGQTMVRMKQSTDLFDTALLQNAYLDTSPSQIGGFASLEKQPGSFSDLVLPDETIAEINTTLNDFLNRSQISTDDLPGIMTILSGPAGTGKTLAAEGIASDLKLPLYRFDYSRIQPGSESQLNDFFSNAESNSAALLFDEAEVLFASKSSDTGPGAMITALLIQKIENYSGLTLLTTNAKQHIDPAFLRRASAVISFPKFTQQQRLTLLGRLINKLGAKVESNVNLNWLTGIESFSGRNISNIAGNAFLAAKARNPQAPEILINGDDFMKAIKKEFK